MKPTPKLTEALQRLKHNADFKVFVEHLAEEAGRQTMEAIFSDGDGSQVDVARGRAQLATHLTKIINDS